LGLPSPSLTRIPKFPSINEIVLTTGATDREVLDGGMEVLFRGISGTGVPKVEIVNPTAKLLEKITFR
jgi:hypothetical protein